MRRRALILGTAAAVALLAGAALLAPVLAPASPAEQVLRDGLQGPTRAHPFGQDRLGRDVLSRVLFGGRVSLAVAGVAVGISLAVGVLIGAAAGACGGWVDETAMRAVDILQAFPGILLAIALAAILGPSLTNVILALSIIGWVGYARLARGQVLVVREAEFVAAATALGAGPGRVLFLHLLPNILGPIIVEATFGLAGAVVAEASLSFLGLGAQPPTPSWGAMLNEGRQYLLVAPHLTIFPGLCVSATVLAINFLGDGLRDLLDPRRR